VFVAMAYQLKKEGGRVGDTIPTRNKFRHRSRCNSELREGEGDAFRRIEQRLAVS